MGLALYGWARTRGADESLKAAAIGSVVYAGVVLFKGVWPLTTLSFVVRESAARILGARARTTLATFAISIVCYPPVALLLGTSSEGAPGLRMRNPLEVVGTGVLLAAGVSLALLWVDHALPPRDRLAPNGPRSEEDAAP